MLTCFSTDDGLVACQDPNLLQRTLDLLTTLLYSVGLHTNIKQTECMIFFPERPEPV
jgi:hypothetical protein